MGWRRRGVILFCLMGIILGDMYGYSADIYLDITKKGKCIIVVPDFIRVSAEKVFSKELTQILRNDLKLSGFFIPIEEGEMTLDENSISYWSSRADFFINVSLTRQDDLIKLDARLYEIGTGRNRFARSYKGNDSARRLLVHNLNDDIVKEITGLKGIATTHIAFVHEEDREKEICIMDYDGGNKRKLTHHRSISINPAWSKDKKVIAYTSYKNGNPNLYMINRTGGESKPISYLPGLNAHSSWRNSRELALTLSVDGNPEIYLLDIEKNIRKRLTQNKKIDSSPCWSPDGEQIAFTSDRGGYPTIYIMRKDGANVKCLTPDFLYADSPDWSPQGDLIAFTARSEGRFNIFIIESDGSGVRQITTGHGDNESPSWAPDNRHLAFSSNRDGKRDIFITDIHGLEEIKITEGNGENFSPSWSPD